MSDADQSGAGRREVAYRIFAAEFDDADFSYSESDEDRAPNYVITPTGARANRLFVVGVLTEVEEVSEDVLRARVVDPTGAFVLYAGQYQPDEQAFLEAATPPSFVAVTGKARTFQPEDGDRIFTSIRPESISDVDVETRDRWTIQAAEQTVDRIAWLARGLASDAEGDQLRAKLREQGADDGLAHGIPLAVDHYGTTPTYLDATREMALDAARVVAGDRDELEPPSLGPAEQGAVTASDLLDSTPDPGDHSATEAVTASDPPSGSEPSPSEGDDTAASEPAPAESVDQSTASAGAEDAAPDDTAGDVEATDGVGDDADTTETEPGSDQDDELGDFEADTEVSGPVADDATGEGVVGADGSDAAGEEIGDFGGSEAAGEKPGEFDGSEATGEGTGEFAPDEFELESETREQIEDEYGTEFQTGTEVDDPGEADIDAPAEQPEDSPESAEGTAEESEPEVSDETAAEAEQSDDVTDEDSPAETDGADEPEDVQATVLEVMDELDDGTGAARSALLAEMAERYDVDEASAEEAIEDALMEGKCYEPDETSLKPI